MNTPTKIKLFLVDDDALFLKSLQIEFMQSADPLTIEYSIQTFPTGELCISNLSSNPDIIILDYHLDGITKDAMNGMQTLDKLKAINDKIPVIILSSQDKIDVAVACMHHKAYDYVVKSETAFLRIQKNITNILIFNTMKGQLNWYMDRM